MAADLGFAKRVRLINKPAEDVTGADIKSGIADFAFTSPPYFAKELYSDAATQSWVRYKSIDEWVKGFLRPTLALQFRVLKPKAHAIVNIADVTIGSTTYPLEDETVKAGEAAGFKYLGKELLPMGHRVGLDSDEQATEPMFKFQKPK
jgi:DNA modification methylase